MKKVILALLLSLGLTGCKPELPANCSGDSCPVDQQQQSSPSTVVEEGDEYEGIYGGPILRFLKRQRQRSIQNRQNRIQNRR